MTPEKRDARASIAADLDRAILLFHFEERVRAAHLRAALAHPAAAQVYRPGMLVLTDFGDAVVETSYEEMRGMMHFIDAGFRAGGGTPSGGAIVAPIDVSFGLSRMYKLLTGDTYPTLEVFRTWDEAVAWLDVDPAVIEALTARLVPIDLKDTD